MLTFTHYQSGSPGTARAFTGQEADPLTGLYYDHARWYDPVMGMFLSVDTKEGNAQGVNPYSYVRENPETMTDPTGERVAGCIPGHDGCGLDGTPTPTGEPGGGGHRPNPGGATDVGNCQENPRACTGGPPPKAVPPTVKQPPDKQKKPTCGSVCLSNGSRWLNWLARVAGALGSGSIPDALFDVLKWISLIGTALTASAWAMVIAGIFHMGRDILFVFNVLNDLFGFLPSGLAGWLHGVSAVLDWLSPFVDLAAFLLSFWTAPIKGLVSKIFDNPIVSVMKKWGVNAIVTTIIKWAFQASIPWIFQGISEAAQGVSPETFCSVISVACENTPPSFIK